MFQSLRLKVKGKSILKCKSIKFWKVLFYFKSLFPSSFIGEGGRNSIYCFLYRKPALKKKCFSRWQHGNINGNMAINSKNGEDVVLCLAQPFNLLAPELFFLILAHSVYKMWLIQEPNKLELWNKLHFKEKKTESIHHI